MTTPTVRVIPKTPQAPRNEGAIRALEEALAAAKANEDASNVMILIKIGGSYYRYSSTLDSPMEVVAQFEVAKSDIILGMAGLIDPQ